MIVELASVLLKFPHKIQLTFRITSEMSQSSGLSTLSTPVRTSWEMSEDWSSCLKILISLRSVFSLYLENSLTFGA